MDNYLFAVNVDESFFLQKIMLQCQNYLECLIKTYKRFDKLPERVELACSQLDNVESIISQINDFLNNIDPEIGNIYIFELNKSEIYTIFWELCVCQRDFELSLLYSLDDIENVTQDDIDCETDRCNIIANLLKRLTRELIG